MNLGARPVHIHSHSSGLSRTHSSGLSKTQQFPQLSRLIMTPPDSWDSSALVWDSWGLRHSVVTIDTRSNCRGWDSSTLVVTVETIHTHRSLSRPNCTSTSSGLWRLSTLVDPLDWTRSHYKSRQCHEQSCSHKPSCCPGRQCRWVWFWPCRCQSVTLFWRIHET